VAYCLMPNHVHLILNPQQADRLGRAVGEAHRRYTNFIHARCRWTGHLFQSRFAVAMDESHLISAVWLCQPEPCPGAVGAAGRGVAMVLGLLQHPWKIFSISEQFCLTWDLARNIV
jgi:hypothetical protein